MSIGWSNPLPRARRTRRKPRSSTFTEINGLQFGFEPILGSVRSTPSAPSYKRQQEQQQEQNHDQEFTDDTQEPAHTQQKKRYVNNEESWKKRDDLVYPMQVELLLHEMIGLGIFV